ncbi:MAG: twin-arginine translocase subunit TatC [Bdellovibrionaceae bacterium]|nr:twin-arginine translocase subunit TatC [Pseudobdellovibrionaceae bacterium]
MSEENFKETAFVEHLKELRKRIVYIMFYLVVGAVIAWIWKEDLFNIVRAPISPYLNKTGGGLSYTSPMESFLGYIKVALLAGTLLSAPLWIHQIWLFIAPALYSKEKKYALGFILSGSLLFILGAVFAYNVVFPFAFKFLLGFGDGTDQAIITIEEYLAFFTRTILIFGLAFEMPLIISVLGMMGVVNDKFLMNKRRYAFLILAIMSAVFTPPDPLSMILMLVPLYGLYELSIVSVKILQPKESL